MTPAAPTARTSVALVGSGVVGTAALQALLAHGGLAVHVAGDEGLARQRDQSTRGGGDALAHAHPFPVVGGRWSTPWLAACDLCLLGVDVVDAPVALEVNARCLEAGVTFLPGLVMGSVAQVGPVTVAGESACLACVDLRLRAATGRSCLDPFGPADAGLARLVGKELGARAIRVLKGDGSLGRRLSHLWPDGSVRHHPVLRTWHCEHCAPFGRRPAFSRPAEVRTGAGPTTGAHILAVPALVDPATGPIRSLERFHPRPDDPPVRHWVAALADPGWAGRGMPTVHCGGNDLDEEASRGAALGEAVERLSLCQPGPAPVVVASYRDVEGDAVDPRAWDLFHPRTRVAPGFPYATVSPDDPISWVWGWSLLRARPVLVPASRVFVPFRARTAADHSDHAALSGSATGMTLADAALGAALEVVERDAFLIAWANRLELPRLDLDPSSPGGVGGYVAAFERCGLDVRCCLATLDHGIPVVVAMARDTRPGEPAMVVAAAAALEPADACRHALRELTANRLHVRHALAASSLRPACDARQVRDEAAHGLLFAQPEAAAHLGHWWDTPSTVALRPPGPSRSAHVGLGVLLENLSGAGLEAVVVDLTPPELGDLGLSVAKVLIPGCYPMSFDSLWPHLGGRRLTMAPVAAGLLDEPVPFEKLNLVPHPFP